MFTDLASAGIACYKKGAHAEALHCFDEALKIAVDGVLLKNRAAVHAALGDLQKAEADLSKAILDDSTKDFKARCLLKRSYVNGQLERHDLALRDAEAAAMLLGDDPETRRQCLLQIGRCRVTLKADAVALKAEAHVARDMVHDKQTLRFNLKVGEKIDVRIGNEFGLWRPADWPSAVHDIAKPVFATLKTGDLTLREPVGESGRVTFHCAGDSQVLIEAEGENWRRPPLAVLSLAENDVGATCGRRIGDVIIAEAPGKLGIGGKVWDASFKLLTFLDKFFDFHQAVLLDVGAGVGAGGLACAKKAKKVVVTDIADVVPLLKLNADLNGLKNVTALELDWFHPPRDLHSYLGPVDVILLADVVYDPDLHEPLLTTLSTLLALRPTLVLLAHRHRNPHDDDFFSQLRAATRVEPISCEDSGDVDLFAIYHRDDPKSFRESKWYRDPR